MHREQHWRARLLIEVEIGNQIAEGRRVFVNARTGVRTPIRAGIDPFTLQEIVFNNLS
jgi:hypothetical protein